MNLFSLLLHATTGRDRAEGWKHAKLSGHENEGKIEDLVRNDTRFQGRLLSRLGFAGRKVLRVSGGGLGESHVQSVFRNGEPTTPKADMYLDLDDGGRLTFSIKKCLSGQVYLVTGENFIEAYEAHYAAIPDPVKRSVYVDATAMKFGIESSILFERISTDRRKINDDTRREAVRNRPVESAEPQYEEPFAESLANTSGLENRTLALAERELDGFLLTNGCDELDFESDSDYYSGDENDKPTVADFIRVALEDDCTTMANSVYRNIYENYFKLYDEGLPQDEIVRKLMNSPDRAMADMAAQLCTEKYRLTVEAFENSLTTTSSWLVTFVPKAILFYNERRLQDRADTIRRSLRGASEQEQEKLMRELTMVQNAQLRIKNKIGREKTMK